MGRWRGRWAVVVIAALVGITACEAGQPAPSPTPTASPSETGTSIDALTLRAAVVLPAAGTVSDEQAEDVRHRLEALGAQLTGRDVSLRLVQPDDAGFAGDVAGLLAADGYDLVCLLGRGSAPIAADLARRFPSTHFCAGPGRGADIPDNLLVFAPRREEGAYVAGVAGALLDPEHPVGLVGAEGTFALDASRAALRNGARSQAAPDTAVEPVLATLAAEAPDVEAVTAALLTAEPSVVVVDALGFTDRVLATVLDAGIPHITWATGADLAGSILILRDRPENMIQRAIEAVLDGTFAGGVLPLGLADDAIDVTPGQDPRGVDLLRRLEPIIEAVASGQVDVLAGP